MHGERFFSLEGASLTYRRLADYAVIPAMIGWTIYIGLLLSEVLPDRWRMSADLAFLIIMAVVLGLNIVRGLIIFYEKRRKFPQDRAIAILVSLIVTAVFAGRVEAAKAIFTSEYLYRITDKSGAELLVRMVRSSSAGFLVAKDGKVIFLPKEEVRKVETTFDLTSEKIK
jgi:hypothetical protein